MTFIKDLSDEQKKAFSNVEYIHLNAWLQFVRQQTLGKIYIQTVTKLGVYRDSTYYYIFIEWGENQTEMATCNYIKDGSMLSKLDFNICEALSFLKTFSKGFQFVSNKFLQEHCHKSTKN